MNILKMGPSLILLTIKSLRTRQRYKKEKSLKSHFVLCMAIAIFLVQLISDALATEVIAPSSVNSTSVADEKTGQIQILSNQARPNTTANSNDTAKTKSAVDSSREHSHTPPVKIKLTGPLDLRVKTTTPHSITLQWRLNPDMKEKIINYRVYYVHENYRDVKTIKLLSHGAYELTGLGERI